MNTTSWMNSFASPNTPENYLPNRVETDHQRLQIEKVGDCRSILRPNPFSHGKDIQAVYPLMGVMAGCWFGGSGDSRPQSSSLRLLRGIGERLEEELPSRAHKPKAVVISPWIDPLLPSLAIQDEIGKIIKVLSSHGIQSWLMTRGFLRSNLAKVMAEHANFVQLRMGFISLDRSLQKLLEPWGSSPELRLKQVRQLQALGIKVQVAIEPMVPGLTDRKEILHPMLEAFADHEIHHISAGYLMLNPGNQGWLKQNLQPHGWDSLVLDQYEDGIFQRFGNSQGNRLLAKNRRQRGYAALMSMAASMGIQVAISTTCNPDFSSRQTPQRPTQARLNLLATSLLTKVPRG